MKKKVVRLTEDDLVRIVKRVIKEQIVATDDNKADKLMDCLTNIIGNEELPDECMTCVTNPTLESCESCFNVIKGKISLFEVDKLTKLIKCFGELKNLGIDF